MIKHRRMKKILKWIYLFVWASIICVSIASADCIKGIWLVLGILIPGLMIWIGNKVIGFSDMIPT